MNSLQSLQETLGIHFSTPSLLAQALVHGSRVNEAGLSSLESNERMEFLGDAVLGAVIAEVLYERFPESTEGELTRLRAVLVSTSALAEIARFLGLGRYLKLGRGEEDSVGGEKPRNLAGALEAVIGAVFLDQGFDQVRVMVLRVLQDKLDSIDRAEIGSDPKTRLQEMSQAEIHQTPEYRIVHSAGPEHEKVFTAQVLVDGVVRGEGSGTSKQRAEQAAARRALEGIQGEGVV